MLNIVAAWEAVTARRSSLPESHDVVESEWPHIRNNSAMIKQAIPTESLEKLRLLSGMLNRRCAWVQNCVHARQNIVDNMTNAPITRIESF